jgi:hypothetical protein
MEGHFKQVVIHGQEDGNWSAQAQGGGHEDDDCPDS